MTAAHGGDIFAIARQHGWDWREVLDFSASINPLGPSPTVRIAIQDALDRIAHYPERESLRLREKLAAVWNIEPSQVLLGNGATELLYFLARTELASGNASVAVPAFSEFHRALPDAGQVPLDDPDVWPTERPLILTRPANPTGDTLSFDSLSRWLSKTSNPVIIDESFLDFTEHQSMAALLSQRADLVILRSLTKFYALPGLRIGALIAHDRTISDWRSRREPWQVNVLAEAAALAALADPEHARRTITFVRTERAWLSDQLSMIPAIEPQPGDANFLLIRLSYSAAKLAAYLASHKVLVRVCTGWPGVSGEAVRIAVRTRVENEQLIVVWRSFPCD